MPERRQQGGRQTQEPRLPQLQTAAGATQGIVSRNAAAGNEHAGPTAAREAGGVRAAAGGGAGAEL